MDLAQLKQRCLIRLVDDDISFLTSMEMMLSMKGWNVRKFSDPESFLKLENFSEPGCIVLDMRMPGISGLELQEMISHSHGRVLPIIFLTAHGDVESAVHTLKQGAFDFLQKPVAIAKLLEAIEAAAFKSVVHLAHKEQFERIKQAFYRLTPREKEIFRLAASGKSNKDISQLLGIAVPTVKMHRSNAFDKLDVHSSTEAANLLKDYDLDH